MNAATTVLPEQPQSDLLAGALESKLDNPEHDSNFDLHAGVNDVLKSGVGLSTSDSGGKLAFYGQDAIIPSPFRFGTVAQSVWPPKLLPSLRCGVARTGEGQDIDVDVRKALRRFCGLLLTGNGKPSMDGAPRPQGWHQSVHATPAVSRNVGW